MANLTQALVGWSMVMGMVFGGVGVLFFTLSLVRAVVSLIRQAQVATPEARETAPAPSPAGR